MQMRGRVRAPDFPPLEWLSVKHPLSLSELRGKIVLLDFFTYGCINCIHVLSELKTLEAGYPEELVVVGVHSAKFAHEGETANLREMVLRFGIEHPVANDQDFEVWHQYAVRAWPTVVLVDPAGYVVGRHSGEGALAVLAPAVSSLVGEFEMRGLLDRRPLSLALERGRGAPALLSYPGKVLAAEDAGLLFVADTGHHRVIVTDLPDPVGMAPGAGAGGRLLGVRAVVGGGAPGFVDGPFSSCRLNAPQGMAFNARERRLYVADVGNHAVRMVDLGSGMLRTLAGTGAQNRSYPAKVGEGISTALNSPWDLELVDGYLYVAMAGNHQIWRLSLAEGWIEPWVGSGVEGIEDGPRLQATLAQPSGLSAGPGTLYFADPESSAIRCLDMSEGWVTALVGTGLFDFGDRDGVGEQALLQHCLGVAFDGTEEVLYVADTYNNKIKRLEPLTRAVTTLAGDQRGWRDGELPLFWEPGGVSVGRNRLFVADTNNHAVRVVDLLGGGVSTLEFARDSVAPAAARDVTSDGGLSGGSSGAAPHAVGLVASEGRTYRPAAEQAVSFEARHLRAGPGRLVLDFRLPDGFVMDDAVPLSVELDPDPVVRFPGGRSKRRVTSPSASLSFPLELFPGNTLLLLHVSLYLRPAAAEGLVSEHAFKLAVPLEVKASRGVSSAESDARLQGRELALFVDLPEILGG